MSVNRYYDDDDDDDDDDRGDDYEAAILLSIDLIVNSVMPDVHN